MGRSMLDEVLKCARRSDFDLVDIATNRLVLTEAWRLAYRTVRREMFLAESLEVEPDPAHKSLNSKPRLT